jgi:hypothetical protein
MESVFMPSTQLLPTEEILDALGFWKENLESGTCLGIRG